jgi:hypothetical protein
METAHELYCHVLVEAVVVSTQVCQREILLSQSRQDVRGRVGPRSYVSSDYIGKGDPVHLVKVGHASIRGNGGVTCPGDYTDVAIGRSTL